MTFELQKDLEATFQQHCTSFAALGQKKGRPEWTPSQKLGSAGDLCLPIMRLSGTKSHVRSPSVVIEARNSYYGVQRTSNSDTEVVAQAVQKLCKCRKTCA
jgi:hypothetical protein